MGPPCGDAATALRGAALIPINAARDRADADQLVGWLCVFFGSQRIFWITRLPVGGSTTSQISVCADEF